MLFLYCFTAHCILYVIMKTNTLKNVNRLYFHIEEQIKAIESLLLEAGDKARKCGITMDELHNLLDLVNEGE